MAWKVPLRRKPVRTGSTSKGLQGHGVRFGTRGREFVSVARIIGSSQASVAKAKVRSSLCYLALGPKGPEVTGTRPEAARSNPSQDEA